MEKLVNKLIEKGLTIASVESLTAGMFSSQIANVAGASKVLYGALVTYQSECKINVLNVDRALVDTYGVISKEVANAMAQQGKKMFQSDIVVSFSGNAGPDVMDNKAVGLVHMAIVFAEQLYSYKQIFIGSRNEIRKQACEFLSNKVLEIIA